MELEFIPTMLTQGSDKIQKYETPTPNMDPLMDLISLPVARKFKTFEGTAEDRRKLVKLLNGMGPDGQRAAAHLLRFCGSVERLATMPLGIAAHHTGLDGRFLLDARNAARNEIW